MPSKFWRGMQKGLPSAESALTRYYMALLQQRLMESQRKYEEEQSRQQREYAEEQARQQRAHEIYSALASMGVTPTTTATMPPLKIRGGGEIAPAQPFPVEMGGALGEYAKAIKEQLLRQQTAERGKIEEERVWERRKIGEERAWKRGELEEKRTWEREKWEREKEKEEKPLTPAQMTTTLRNVQADILKIEDEMKKLNKELESEIKPAWEAWGKRGTVTEHYKYIQKRIESLEAMRMKALRREAYYLKKLGFGFEETGAGGSWKDVIPE